MNVSDDENENPAERLAKRSAIHAMLEFAQPLMPVLPNELDQNEYLLNCPNGMIDLRTGNLLNHERWRYITKLCPTEYDPHAEAPIWLQFLSDVFVNPELVSFVQRFLGYCLTADVSEQKLPIFFGSGANGKSTLLNAFMDVIGPEYTMQAMPDLLMEKTGNAHPTERAALFGKRFVSCVETDASRKLSESMVKMLTGGERIMARRMKEDFWEFEPSHKLVLCTNHKPVVTGTDHGIWRRMLLVPFTQRFEGSSIDKKLPEKLRAEAEGILVWLVRGCQEWVQIGLSPPPVVSDATKEYQSQEDVIGRFIRDCYQETTSDSTKFSNLYRQFEIWAVDNGESCCSKKLLGNWLIENGYKKHRSNGVWYRGLILKE
jgi:putative DNA primase/helicase